MADNEEEGGDGGKAGGGMMGKLIIWGAVFAMGAGTGIATAMFVFPSGEEPINPVPVVELMDIPEPDEGLAFVEFDEVVVNLNDNRYSRYVTCKFSLQIAQSQLAAIEKLVDDKQAILTNWLIAHLRDKKLEDVKGKLGHNTLRREIHDQFNAVLFTDGIERIQDVLFQDLKIQ